MISGEKEMAPKIEATEIITTIETDQETEIVIGIGIEIILEITLQVAENGMAIEIIKKGKPRS